MYQVWYQVEPNKWVLWKQTFEEIGNQGLFCQVPPFHIKYLQTDYTSTWSDNKKSLPLFY
jgi:hypothetical protein